MSDIIHLLPDSIANQIAAGEVIQRPASVVKELVENAVDAGAGHIQVNIKDAGRTLVQVIDDGKGMSETDARMAFERHATSKISTADDLFSLHTMGFRGEALASIVAVSQVELRTRLKGAELGTHLVFSGSELESVEPDACTEGSIFSVKNLFFNVPARRKFLKSNETEFRNIINEFERIALVNSQVALSLYHNDTEIFNLPESGLRQRIVNDECDVAHLEKYEDAQKDRADDNDAECDYIEQEQRPAFFLSHCELFRCAAWSTRHVQPPFFTFYLLLFALYSVYVCAERP